MPIYEYLCPECNCVYSFLSKIMSEHKQPVCPKCDTNQVSEALYAEPFVVTDDDLDAAMGRDFDDDKSLPGDLDIEVDGLDGDDLMLPMAAEDYGDDLDLADDL